MELGRPFRVVTPTVDGDVLAVLCGADAAFTPPQVHALVGRHSEDGVRKALRRLARQGIVLTERVGNAVTYQLNRDHIAAEQLVGLSQTRARLIARIQALIATWPVACEYAALFGSAARGEMTPDSDIDIFVVRPSRVDADDERWAAQVAALSDVVTRWTGNDARLLELDAAETAAGLQDGRAVLEDVRDEGVRLAGRPGFLRHVPADA